MLYTDWEVGGVALKLRLNSRACVELEQKLGRNPVEIFLEAQKGKLPTVGNVVAILHASLQALEHGYTEAKTYDVYDAYIDEGHNLFDLVPVILDVFQASGLIGGAESGDHDPNAAAGK